MKVARVTNRAGFTLLEVLIATALGSIILVQVTMALNQTRDIQRTQGNAMKVEAMARQVLDRVAYAIMGSNQATLLPQLSPELHSTQIRYEYSLGLKDGEVIWSDPEMIELTMDGRSVRWRQNPDAVEERDVLWTNLVRPILEGELDNNIDDNANGLEDEEGFHFLIDGPKVTVRLSLEAVDEEGVPYIHSAETTVVCRNQEGASE